MEMEVEMEWRWLLQGGNIVRKGPRDVGHKQQVVGTEHLSLLAIRSTGQAG